MYCHVCGTKSSPGDSTCRKCRTKLKDSGSTEEQIWAETAVGLESGAGKAVNLLSRQHQSAPKQSNQGRAFSWIIPLLLAAVMGALLTYYYKQEMGINSEVKSLHQQAEQAALEGKYKEALQLLDTALAKRPNYNALVQDRQITAKAFNLMNQLNEAATSLKTGKLSAGDKTIQAVTKVLNEREEPVFSKVRATLNNRKVTLAVLKVKKEIDSLTTVEALAEKLDTVSNLKGKEAEAVQKQIIDKMAGLSYKQAEQQVKKKDFTAALQTVDQGLSYAPENEKLTAYRDRVLSEKKAFEKAEAERIELAEQQAAEEDLKNRTAAVSIVSVDAALDMYGDLYISGSIVNNATRPISSVTVMVDIYGTDGSYLGQSYVDVYPSWLDVGEEGFFETYYYGVYQEAEVSVVNATWYLE
ncbi:FxLYD domain-containing protein [Paenibacillus sp. UMB7766-LJ446]|uniref:FxLYD domain-containing protein n=1 Tax=Paenibacillus sp. UMB7766-LJ446 TaxID=3046313 RepID=UPI002550AE85|nr:FxLYD domain-containing protein [Paenibacillus sp. UMB7766-LJ446]MDK8193868.1 FxLYD domain-containing protein [Paenibacillus sp. UMB7766-LJ446]